MLSTPMMTKPSPPAGLPRLSRPLTRLFTRYSRGYLRRNFHSVRLLKTHDLALALNALPVVVFLNHAAWWDPLICMLLAAEKFPAGESFAPIDERALRRYRFLARLGFFGIEIGSSRGAVEFLKTAEAILSAPTRMLWLTPQGKFTDIRERPVSLQRGLAHLAGRLESAVFLPLAIEYSFWEGRLPEVLVAFGNPLFTRQHRDSCGADDWNTALTLALQDTQDALAEAAQRRQRDEWQVLLRGRSGTAPVYDLWQRMRAAYRGEPYTPEHSDL